jgi:outer membrane protein assembly factor BamE
MRPARTFPPKMLAAATLAGLLAACVYRVDTQQGNLLEAEQIDQVEVGMTRSQVRFLLGTPMVADPFDQSRWDYVYYFRSGKTGRRSKSHVIVWFDGDTVARIDMPEPVAPTKRG